MSSNEPLVIQYSEHIGEWLALRNKLPRNWAILWMGLRAKLGQLQETDRKPSKDMTYTADAWRDLVHSSQLHREIYQALNTLPFNLIALSDELLKLKDFDTKFLRKTLSSTKDSISVNDKQTALLTRHHKIVSDKLRIESTGLGLPIHDHLNDESIRSAVLEALRKNCLKLKELLKGLDSLISNYQVFTESVRVIDAGRKPRVFKAINAIVIGETEVIHAEILNELVSELSYLSGWVTGRIEADIEKEELFYSGYVEIPKRHIELLITDKKRLEEVLDYLNNDEYVKWRTVSADKRKFDDYMHYLTTLVDYISQRESRESELHEERDRLIKERDGLLSELELASKRCESLRTSLEVSLSQYISYEVSIAI